MVLAKRIDRPFSFKSEVAKIKISLPFDEIYRNTKYRNQLIKMLKSNDKSIFSDSVNLQDDNPTILFGPRMEPNADTDVPPFYVTFKVDDLNLHNSMFDSGASIKQVFFPLIETNLFESSSSRLETYENDKLLIFPIQTHDRTEIMMSVVCSSKCHLFNKYILRSTSSDLQLQTKTMNLPRGHTVLDYEIESNTIKHSFA